MPDITEVTQQITQDDTAVAIPILQRNGKPYLAPDGTRATISVLGSESKRFKKARDEIYRAAAESPSVEGEDGLARIRVAAAGVTAWHGWTANGQEVPCTPEHVAAVLTVEHVLTQVEAGIQRRTDFFGDGSGT